MDADYPSNGVNIPRRFTYFAADVWFFTLPVTGSVGQSILGPNATLYIVAAYAFRNLGDIVDKKVLA